MQIVDSGSDEQVVSDIRELGPSLHLAGFQEIIGVRDLRPISRAHLGKLVAGINSSVAGAPIPCLVVVSVMETETWFLGEYSHFEHIHPNLTVARIQELSGVHLPSHVLEEIDEAAELLMTIYASESVVYDKSEAAVSRTVAAIDMQRLLAGVALRLPSVRAVADRLQTFLV